MVDRSKLSLPIISQSEGQGPDRWYHPCDVPRNTGDEHVRLFGKTKVNSEITYLSATNLFRTSKMKLSML